MTSQRKRLHWGCGELRPDDWINADSQPGPGVDIACDIIIDGLPLESDSMELVYCSPALQSLPAHELVPALRELRRVLKPGGLLRLCVPDFDRALQAYRREGQSWRWCWDWETQDGNFLTQLTNYGYARSLFTREFMNELLCKAGFCDISTAAFGRSSSPVPGCADLDRRPDECLFTEASKPAATQGVAVDDGSAPQQIHLSWVEDPSTSLTVSWNMPVPGSDCALEYRRRGAGSWNRVPSDRKSSLTTRTLFSATMRDLSPDIEYDYRIAPLQGAAIERSGIFRTRTAPPPAAADFRFVFFCDTGVAGRPDGNASGTQQVIEEMGRDKPLFMLGGGDYAYANHDGRYSEAGEAIDAWFEQMQPLLSRYPLMAQYGNHEIYLVERFRDWAPRFSHPSGFADSRNYSFSVADAHFTSLFVTGNRLSPEQLAWLEADLGSARERGIRWLIVYQHEPVFAHGHSHPANPEYRQWLAPLFERYRVDLHLSGHDQNYERTYPLVMAANEPMRTSSALDYYHAGQGVIYAKVSPAGKKSESGNDFSRFTVGRQAFMAKRNDAAHHYALVSTRACGEVQVEVFGVPGDGTPKVMVDSFRIVAGNEQKTGDAGCEHPGGQVDP
jgi:hypothetical protein